MDDKKLTIVAEGILSIFPMFMKNFGKIDDLGGSPCLPNSHKNILCLLNTFDTLKMSDISQKLCINKCNLTPIINNLINLDLVAKFVDEEDRRIYNIRLTKKGNEFVENQKKLTISKVKENFSSFNDEDINGLVHHLNGIKEILCNVKSRSNE
ncbi:MAG: MarR family transcriptional regulator [Clostridium sp.]